MEPCLKSLNWIRSLSEIRKRNGQSIELWNTTICKGWAGSKGNRRNNQKVQKKNKEIELSTEAERNSGSRRERSNVRQLKN